MRDRWKIYKVERRRGAVRRVSLVDSHLGLEGRSSFIRVLIISGAIILGVIGGVVAQRFFFSLPQFKVAEVRILDNSSLKKEEIGKLTQDCLGENIFRVRLSDIGGRIARHPRIKEVEVCRKLPQTILVRVREREVVALISDLDLYEVDEEGVILGRREEVRESDLPLITGVEIAPEDIGQRKESPNLELGLRFLKEAKRLGLPLLNKISEINVRNRKNLCLYTLENATEIWLGSDGFGDKLLRLRYLWEDIKRRSKVAKYIDLRFEGGAVVRFAQRNNYGE